MRKLNKKGPFCSMCGIYGHGDTKCPNLNKYLDMVALVISTNSLGDEWLDETGSLDIKKLLADSYSLINFTYLSVKALDASNRMGTSGLPPLKDSPLLYKAIRAKRKQNNYKVAGAKRRGKAHTRASKCGYCRTTGHTRRTCDTMIKDKTLILDANKLYRQQFAARMNSLSLGAGALLKFTINADGIVGKKHGWYDNYPDSFLSIVPELAFKDCTVFNMVSNYDYSHKAIIKHHPVGITAAQNSRIDVDLPVISHGRFFDKAFGKNEQKRHVALGPKSSHGLAAYDVTVAKPSNRQEFTEEWINEETPWFMELFKKAKLNSYEWNSAFDQVQKWYQEAKVLNAK